MADLLRSPFVATCLVCFLTAMPASVIAQAAQDTADADTAATDEEEVVLEGEFAEQEEAAAPPEELDTESTRPAILGMTVEEELDGRAFVTDIGATSPAWDAGVRKGDEIVSLHGMKVESFPEWVEGVRKVVTDAVDGQSIPIHVVRDGSPLELQVKVPVQRSDDIPRPADIRQSQIIAQQPVVPGAPGNQPVPYPAGGGGGGGGVGVVPFGVDGAEGGVGTDRVPLRAAAQLQVVSNLPAAASQPPAGIAPGPAPTAPEDAASGNVGTAVFVDGSTGMLAGVTLSGLPPGSYRVGIGDPSGAGQLGAGNNVSNATSRRNSETRVADEFGSRQALRPPQGQPQPVPPQTGRPIGQPGIEPKQPGGAGSATPPNTGRDNSGAHLPPTSSRVLAQVTPGVGDQPVNPSDPTAGLPPQTQDATGKAQSQPGSAPPSGVSNSPAGQVWVELGMIQVQTNGMGQLRQRLEGVRVANVVGQSVLVMNATSAGGGAPVAGRGAQGGVDSRQRNLQGAGAGAAPTGIVASGVIQLIDSGATGEPPSGQTQVPGGSDTAPPTQPGVDRNAPIPPQTTNPLPAPQGRN